MDLKQHSKRAFQWLGFACFRLCKLLFVSAFLALMSAPLVGSRAPSLLEQIQAQGVLKVISRNGPTTYYEGADGYTGFEYTLARAFARHLGVALEIVEEEDLTRMLDRVGRHGHFAAAGLTVTERRQRKVNFSLPYMQVTQQLIYNVRHPRPTSIDDLIGKHLLVISGSSHGERLRELQRDYPDLAWEERHDIEMLDLIEMVHSEKIDYAILDSNAVELNAAVYPRAKVAFEISDSEPLAWAFPQSGDTSLLQAANDFLAEVQLSGTLAEIQETFYGHLGEIGYADALVFARRVNERLPKWKDALQQAAEETQLDWLLLAALGYQESHWNPRARSPTGVRGFMMLTLNTAKEMEVTNRLDPHQSITGGSRYFRKLLDRIPPGVTGKDRVWLALAAYNIGYGHLEDARIITQQHGGNPNRWADVKEYLPLLSKRQYYKFTRHGYARGQEAVTYVQNIRNFYTILAWHDSGQDRTANMVAEERDKPDNEFGLIVSEVVANQQFATSPL